MKTQRLFLEVALNLSMQVESLNTCHMLSPYSVGGVYRKQAVKIANFEQSTGKRKRQQRGLCR